MEDLSEIDAVLVDVGGVLVLPVEERVHGALATFDVTIERLDLERAHYHGIAALVEGHIGHHADGHTIWHAYNRAYARMCGVGKARIDEATTVLLEEFARGDIWRQPIPGAREALGALADRGLALAIVSNADGTVETDLRKYAICQVGPGEGVPVHAILDSTVVGAWKPDPAIFHQALDALGVAPERAVHVGDTPATDVAGARAAGVRPVLVDPYDLHVEIDCLRVRSLHEVVDLLPA